MDLLCGIRAEVEEERGVPCDNHQIAKPGEACNDVFGDPLTEMIVARVARKVGKGQNSDRRVLHDLRLWNRTPRCGDSG